MNRLSRLPAPSILALSLATAAMAEEFTPNHVFVPGAMGRIVEFDDTGAYVATHEVGGATSYLNSAAFGPDGALHAADFNFSEIRCLTAGGEETTQNDGGLLEQPGQIAFGPNGCLLVASRQNSRLVTIPRTGPAWAVTTPSLAAGNQPQGLAFRIDGHIILNGNNGSGLRLLAPNLRGVSGGADGAFLFPGPIALGRNGCVYACDLWADAVRVYTADTLEPTDTMLAPEPLIGAYGVVQAPNGNLLVSSHQSGVVLEMSETGAVQQVLSAPTLLYPTQPAIAPFRFRATISGKLYRAGSGVAKIVDKNVVLSLAPNSGTAMILLADGPSSDDLADAFATTALVFHGREAAEDDQATKRALEAAQVPADAAAGPFATIALAIKGTIAASGAFEISKASGSLAIAGSAASFTGTIKTRLLLD